MTHGDGGKGSARRPGEGYEDNWERIFGKKTVPQKMWCAVRGASKPGCMCSFMVVGDKSCGAPDGMICEHQTVVRP